MYESIESQAITPTGTEVMDINTLVAANTHDFNN